MAAATPTAKTDALLSKVKALNSKKLLVRWTLLNHDLGKHHNEFVHEFPDCLFVRVIACGPGCSLQPIGTGGIALIKEDVMIANGVKIQDGTQEVTFDRDAPFLISEHDVIAFGQFGPIEIEADGQGGAGQSGGFPGQDQPGPSPGPSTA